MRTTEEIIRAAHERAHAVQRRNDNTRTAVTGAACAALAGCLVFLVARFGGAQHEILPSEYSGASLLADGAGGYVLVGLVAFMAGAVVTTLIRRGRRKKDGEE